MPELRDQIRSLQQRLSITTVFVTHDQEEALSMADRVCVMQAGRIEQTATPAMLYARPATAFVAEFVGVSSRVPVERAGNDVVVFGQRVPGSRRSAKPPACWMPSTPCLRPEDVAIEVDPDGKGIRDPPQLPRGDDPPRRPGRRESRSVSTSAARPPPTSSSGTHVNVQVISRDVLVAPRLAKSDTAAS